MLRSVDEGSHWSYQLLPNSGDPDALFMPDGRAWWTFIGGPAQKRALSCRFSPDGGGVWDDVRVLDAGVKCDHPHNVCDRGNSKFAGNIYVAGRNFLPGVVDVFRSSDGGKQFAHTAIGLKGRLASGFGFRPVVLSDGTLLIPYITSNLFFSDSRDWYAGSEREIYCLRSADGGVSFDAPVHIVDINSPADAGVGGADELGGFAVGDWNGHERIYLSYCQELPHHQAAALMMCTSGDAGLTWTPPHAIVVNPPHTGAGSCSTLAGPDGTVGVQWYALGEKQFDLYFSASVDGGVMFSPPMRISSQSSQIPPDQSRAPGQDQVYGDAAGGGRFGLAWTDARNHSGAYVIYMRQAIVTRQALVNPMKVLVDGVEQCWAAGATIPLSAMAPAGQEFSGWKASEGIQIDDPASPIAAAVLPTGASAPLQITATWRAPALHKLTVTGGSGSGEYAQGQRVSIAASPASGRSAFAGWQGENGLQFVDPKKASTRLRMGDHDATITASFKSAEATPEGK
jgi:hypothetical protein